jgi:formylglycine-generating enzyme required for sulfatase activity
MKKLSVKIGLIVLCFLLNYSRFPAKIQEKEIINSIGMKLKLVKAGTFVMGSDDGGPIGQSKPAHKVTLSYDFYLGVHEVTQSQYQEIMGENPSDFIGPDYPVSGVTFEQAEEFCKRLSRREGAIYRLPYEAEWEYCYRAGTATTYPWGDELNDADNYGWHNQNSNKKPHPVGIKKPNIWGFHDMSGNVQEYVRDIYGLYEPGPAVDPRGAAKPWGSLDCTLRGGSFELARELFDSSFRHGVKKASNNPINTDGFRVVKIIE